jgi:hypothetical protein
VSAYVLVVVFIVTGLSPDKRIGLVPEIRSATIFYDAEPEGAQAKCQAALAELARVHQGQLYGSNCIPAGVVRP